MSFNIRYGTADDRQNHWERRRDLVFATLRDEKPDVAGLQEALRFQIDEIRSALPGYGEVGQGRDAGSPSNEFTVILYRRDRLEVADEGTFWFSDTPEVAGSRSWGNRIPRICSWARFLERETGRGFYIYNVHIDHESQASRERSVQFLLKVIRLRRTLDPVVVTGDFNAGEHNPVIGYMKGERLPGGAGGDEPVPPALVDTFRVLHPDDSDAATFHGFTGRVTGEKIDFIFAAPWVRVLDAAILRRHDDGRYPSDHYPVTARLAFPPAGGL